MAKLLFVVFPATGHINPGLPIARELVRAGHNVRWYSIERFRRAIESAGARFVPYKRATPLDESALDQLPGRPKGGLRQLQWDIKNIFVGNVGRQFADIEEERRRQPADLIVADSGSVVSAVASEKLKVPFVVFGVTVITFSGRDVAPFGLALMPSALPLGRLRTNFCTG